MSSIKIFNHSIPAIGYISRTSTKGNEFDMVNQYINSIIKKYSKLKNKRVAIFIEPQIDTGYPDIVIVEYYGLKQVMSSEHRIKLTIKDLKILYHIQQHKNKAITDLSDILGYSVSEVEKSTERLAECELVHLSKTKKYVRNVSLDTYCRIKKIISIEAKLDKWSEAIRQAEKNIWFSTESYILMNKEGCNETIQKHCAERGIGIILVNGKINTILKSHKRAFPVSFASLQFNEWIQKEFLYQEEQV